MRSSYAHGGAAPCLKVLRLRFAALAKGSCTYVNNKYVCDVRQRDAIKLKLPRCVTFLEAVLCPPFATIPGWFYSLTCASMACHSRCSCWTAAQSLHKYKTMTAINNRRRTAIRGLTWGVDPCRLAQSPARTHESAYQWHGAAISDNSSMLFVVVDSNCVKCFNCWCRP